MEFTTSYVYLYIYIYFIIIIQFSLVFLFFLMISLELIVFRTLSKSFGVPFSLLPLFLTFYTILPTICPFPFYLYIF